MSGDIHPFRPRALPPFVGGSDGSDPLSSAIIFIVGIAVLGSGVLHAVILRMRALLRPVQMLVFAGH